MRSSPASMTGLPLVSPVRNCSSVSVTLSMERTSMRANVCAVASCGISVVVAARIRWRNMVTSRSDDGGPFRRELLRAAQREREDGVGRVGSARGGEDAGPGHVEVRQLVRLSVAVHHRVLRARPHDGAAHEVDGRHGAAAGPRFLRAGGLGDLQALLEVRVPYTSRVLVEAVHDAAK